MAVTYESDGGTVWCNANNNTAINITLPATRPAGSVLLFVAWCRLISAAAPAPSGYTLLNTWTSGTASGGRMWLYAKEVDGTETAPLVTPAGTTGTSGDIWGACIYCYSGVDLSGGISAILDGTPTTTDAAGTTTCTYPALTISSASSYVVRFLCRFRDAADTFTFTSTWAEREDAGTTTRLGGQHHLQDKQASGSGSQASVTVAPSNTTSSRYLAVTAALKAGTAPFLRSQSRGAAGTNTFVTVTKPTGTVDGDGLLAFIIIEGNENPRTGLTAPSGWTLELDDFSALVSGHEGRLLVYSKRAASEPADWTWSWTNSGWREALVFAYQNIAASGDFIDGVTASTVVNGTSINWSTTTTANNTLLVLGGRQFNAGAYTGPGIELYDGSTGEEQCAYQVLGPVSAGATGTKTITSVGSGQLHAVGAVLSPTTISAGPTTYYGATSSSYSFAATTAAQRKTFSSLAWPTTIGITVAGTRKFLGALLAPFAFAAVIAGQRRTTSSLVMPVTFAAVTAGQRRTTSSLAMPVTFAAVTAAQRRTTSSLAMPVTFAATTAGARKTTGSLVMPVAFAAATAGRRTAISSLAMPVTFSAVTAAQRRTTSSLVMPVTFGAFVNGRRSVTGTVGLFMTFTPATQGVRKTFGVVTRPVTFGSTTQGTRKFLGATTVTVTFTRVVQGTRKTFSSLAWPTMITIATQGVSSSGAVTYYGQVSLPLAFSAVTAGRRRTTSSLAVAVVFAGTTAGRRKTFGVVARPISFGAVTAGRRGAAGSVAMPITFSRVVQGRRKTFGVVTQVTTFAAVTEARRKTFAVTTLPLTVAITTQGTSAGPVTHFGQVELRISFQAQTAGVRLTLLTPTHGTDLDLVPAGELGLDLVPAGGLALTLAPAGQPGLDLVPAEDRDLVLTPAGE